MLYLKMQFSYLLQNVLREKFLQFRDLDDLALNLSDLIHHGRDML